MKIKNKDTLTESFQKIVLNGRVLDSIKLAQRNIAYSKEKWEAKKKNPKNEVYIEILNETIEDLDKVIFFIEQVREGFLK